MSRRSPAGRLNGAAIILAAALAVAPSVAGAQQVLPPTYGSTTLSTDRDDMVTVDLQAGGPISATQVLGPPCAGMVADAPDYTVVLQGRGQAELAVAVTSQADTTLIVGLPNGRWLCADDSNGINPAITIPGAVAAPYNIWVGTYEAGGFPPAQLVVRTLTGVQPGAPTAAPTPIQPPTPTPAVDAGDYWYAAEGAPVGPVPLSDIDAAIEAGTVTRETLVWQDGMDAWQPAEAVPAIEALFPAMPPPLPVAPPPLPQAEPEPVGPPPLPPAGEDAAPPAEPEGGKGPGQEGEAVEDEAAAAPSHDQLMTACRGAAEAFRLNADEIDPTCECVVGHLTEAGLAPDALAPFAGEFAAAAEALRTENQALYDAVDDACF